MTGPERDGYPLRTLERLRLEIRERRERELAAAVQALEEGARSLAALREACAAAARELETERARLSGAPGVTVAEAERGRRYLARLGAVVEARARERREAEAEQARRAAACSQARAALAGAQAELEALAKHHASWDRARREREERRAEQELEDLAAARRR